MAQPNPVKVIEVSRVALPPHPPCSAAQTSLPLSLFDVLWLRFPPTQRLFFYELPHPKTTLSETILPKLKHSLSVTLQHYFPIAGNITWPPDSSKPFIQYSEGDTVSLTVAESETDFFYNISGNGFREAEKFHHFLPNLEVSEVRVPVLALQVTLFPNAGFSIGYAAHHAVFDGKSIAIFIHSWASICKRSGGEETLTPELTPFYDRAVVIDPSGMEFADLKILLQLNGPNNKSLMFRDIKAPPEVNLGTFQLTKLNIESMKKWVKAKWQEKPAFHPSTLAMTTAYTWVCMIKTRKLRTEKVRLIIPVDCRARLEPPVPSTYFGNCVTGLPIVADTKELVGEDGVAIAVRLIGEAIKGLDDGVLKGEKLAMSFTLSAKPEELVGFGSGFSLAGSPRFEFYKTDFGWGTPKKVEMISIAKTGAFYLSDSRDGNGGVEIGVALEKHETEAFASLFSTGLVHHQNP